MHGSHPDYPRRQAGPGGLVANRRDRETDVTASMIGLNARSPASSNVRWPASGHHGGTAWPDRVCDARQG